MPFQRSNVELFLLDLCILLFPWIWLAHFQIGWTRQQSASVQFWSVLKVCRTSGVFCRREFGSGCGTIPPIIESIDIRCPITQLPTRIQAWTLLHLHHFRRCSIDETNQYTQWYLHRHSGDEVFEILLNFSWFKIKKTD